MIEPIGPAMAKSILGDSYSSDYRYELETTEEGLQVIITNKETGESSVLKLSDDITENQHYDPIYDEETIRARGEYAKRGRIGFVCAVVAWVVVIAALLLTVWFIRP